METKTRPSRQLDFSGQEFSEQGTRIKDEDFAEFTTIRSVDEDNKESTPLQTYSNNYNEFNISSSSTEKKAGHQKTNNTLQGDNVQGSHNSGKMKPFDDKKPLITSESVETVNFKNCLENIARDTGMTVPSFISTEDFDMSSDDDLFGDPKVLESLCSHTEEMQHTTKNQANGSDEHKSDSDETQCVNSTQINEKEILPVKSNTTQRQQSLSSFVKKSNKKSASSLKQTDIGVFFGLKPVSKPFENKMTGAKNVMDASTSSVTHKHGGWRGRKQNNSCNPKNTGYSSEGQSSGAGEDVPAVTADSQSRRSCPFYKRIPGSTITVDAFRYGDIPGCCAYFLSHFHYDHYAGLNGKFTNPVYCSKVSESTCKLLKWSLSTKRTAGLVTGEFNIDEITYVGTCSSLVS